MEVREVGVPVSARVRANHTVAWEQAHLVVGVLVLVLEAENLEPEDPVADPVLGLVRGCPMEDSGILKAMVWAWAHHLSAVLELLPEAQQEQVQRQDLGN